MRPILSPKLSKKAFQDFYWEKKELIAFCTENNIPCSGSKQDIEQRIAHFLEHKEILPAKAKKRAQEKDSKKEITTTTPVVHYTNDAKTRAFFVSQIGPSFSFNGYLREFAKKEQDGSLSYGDLVEGYNRSLHDKKKSIPKQFQYNQFTRDFFQHETNPTRESCIQAWNYIRSLPGKATYAHYKETLKQGK